jgi:hypothetical protein
MQVKLIKENPDGSADVLLDMQPDELEMLLLNGIRCAIEAGIARGSAWRVDALPDLLDDDESPAVGLTE